MYNRFMLRKVKKKNKKNVMSSGGGRRRADLNWSSVHGGNTTLDVTLKNVSYISLIISFGLK